MSTVVVLGGGIGGLSAAFELKDELGDRHDIVLVSDLLKKGNNLPSLLLTGLLSEFKGGSDLFDPFPNKMNIGFHAGSRRPYFFDPFAQFFDT